MNLFNSNIPVKSNNEEKKKVMHNIEVGDPIRKMAIKKTNKDGLTLALAHN